MRGSCYRGSNRVEGDKMNRPYRDDEEKQRDRVERLLEDVGYYVHLGELDMASGKFCEADQALDHLCEMVKTFDEDEARGATDE